MVVLGIDPGLARVGYGVLRVNNGAAVMVECGMLETPAGMATPKRLDSIYRGVAALIRDFAVQAVAVEELFFNKNITTGIAVAQARGVILAAACAHLEDIYEYTPLQVKQAVVGYGRADKQQVQQMVKALLRLEKVPQPDDAADALAVALCHVHTARMQEAFRV